MKFRAYSFIVFTQIITLVQNVFCLAPPAGSIKSDQFFSLDYCLNDISKRYAALTEHSITEEEIRVAIAGIFGMNDVKEPWEDSRLDDAIRALYNSSNSEHYLSILISNLDKYKGSISGRHRYIPLVQAVINLFNHKNLLSRPTDEMLEKSPELRYLIEKYLLYANPFNVNSALIPSYIPSLVLPLPEKKQIYRWLDIGSAPKTGGAPGMMTLHKIFKAVLPKKNLKITSSDIIFPQWRFNQDGSITPQAEYRFDDQGKCLLNDIMYLNAGQIPAYNVMHEQFNLSQQYDFISVCRILHQLKKPHEKRTFGIYSDEHIQFVDENGDEDNLSGPFYPSQINAVKKLLSSLTIGGILFVEISSFNPGNIFDWVFARQEGDVFCVIQRKNKKKFIVYDKFIPFRASPEPYRSRDILLNVTYSGTFTGRNLYDSYPGLDPAFFEIIGSLLDAADKIAYPYQKRPFAISANLFTAVYFTFTAWPDLTHLFANYLESVPDDCEEKQLLLQNVSYLNRIIQALEPGNITKLWDIKAHEFEALAISY